MRFKTCLAALCLGIATIVGSGRVVAQPAPNAAPFGGQALPDGWDKMTPQQRREAAQKIMETTLRGLMTALGYADKDTQDAVVEAALEREKSLEKVREKHYKLTKGLLAQLPDPQIEEMVETLRDASIAAHDERIQTLQILNDKTDYIHKPRLRAFLDMVGITDDDTAIMGGVVGSTLGTITNFVVQQAEEFDQRK